MDLLAMNAGGRHLTRNGRPKAYRDDGVEMVAMVAMMAMIAKGNGGVVLIH